MQEGHRYGKSIRMRYRRGVALRDIRCSSSIRRVLPFSRDFLAGNVHDRPSHDLAVCQQPAFQYAYDLAQSPYGESYLDTGVPQMAGEYGIWIRHPSPSDVRTHIRICTGEHMTDRRHAHLMACGRGSQENIDSCVIAFRGERILRQAEGSHLSALSPSP